MEAVLKRLQTLTSDQLRDELSGAGLRYGPITATTRSVFEKKLARALLEEAPGHSGSSFPEEEVRRPVGEQSREEARCEAEAPEPSVYYGVCPEPDDPAAEQGSPHVFVDKTEALKTAVKLKGARFKAFARKEDAEKFAKGLCVSPIKPSPEKTGSDAVNLEKANEFKSPRTQELTAKLRRSTERGDEEAFRELVWGNPRYLIGSGDNPTILQEGCRYNVLHVASKENQAGIARLLLETLEDPDFMRLMYPNDSELMLRQRMRYIVDLYLNTPDRAGNETPLHFACKFGCAEVVDVLCSHPSLDKHRRNKYEQEPSAVICERRSKSKELKQRILGYLEDRFYVPLLRAADNTLPPVIGSPWCLGSETAGQSHTPEKMMDSPKNPRMTLTAFAGPLTSSKAEEFHRLWKTPRRERAGYFHQILKTDSERGAERVGRELSRELGLPWAEYWPFLRCFVDLSSRDGLEMLEEHLSSPSGRLFPVRDLLQEFEKVVLERSADSDDDSGSDEYFTADEVQTDSSGSSFQSTHSPTGRPALGFMAGDSPSKLDGDVLVALKDVEIEPLSYPSILRWRNKILSYSPSQRQRWTETCPSDWTG
ncbi:ankyrin repeat and LEM domain-containing protein 2 isoform X2 [Puntigrus tetrazona]|uniref:ankyrin repeat and LEM domain-containing protein 2 isoform X2 n=1 Tax=Puntigrus tetrazona TaxID=1606681 RepID=UPI001C89F05F|nr:ankyrin repeat and LEM domain-containing protein 2 isoform X2 [Puntigrus tetrazona]